MRRAVRTDRDLNNTNSADQHGFVQEEPIPTHTWPPESYDVTSGDEDSLMGLSNSVNKGVPNNLSSTSGNLVVDPVERRSNAMQILHSLLYESNVLAPNLIEFLCAKYVNLRFKNYLIKRLTPQNFSIILKGCTRTDAIYARRLFEMLSGRFRTVRTDNAIRNVDATRRNDISKRI